MKQVLAVVGTRPDAIKMAPVILELQKHDDLKTRVIASGQHKEMLQQVFDCFGIEAERDFGVMRESQSLAYLTSSILEQLDAIIEEVRPDIVIAQGDTTTTFAAALASFYRKAPFGHVEAGLRTETIESPFPEEFNRRAVSQVARLHFAPTRGAVENLLAERVPADWIFVTGNTSIDAILETASRIEKVEPMSTGRMVLVTTHRRENWGDPQRNICRALKRLLHSVSDVYVVLAMHRNPVVRDIITDELRGQERVFLIEPPEYKEFASLMKSAEIILTDSGGVQEEAPSLGKPVLVLRRETERPEGLESGNAMLVGTDEKMIFEAAHRLLTDARAREAMSHPQNPYGDGKASKRICAEIRRYLVLPHESISQFKAARTA